MKKVLVLLITSLAMLMADITLENKQLTPVVESTPPPTTTAPVNTPGIIPNSVDLIWADMHDATNVTPVATGAMGQSMGPVFYGYFNMKNRELWTAANAWYEVEEDAGKGNYCSLSINEAKNVNVEIGRVEGYWLDNSGTWHTLTSTDNGYQGKKNPTTTLMPAARGCSGDTAETFNQLRLANDNYTVLKGKTQEGHPLFDPKHTWRYHGWAKGQGAIDKNTIKAIYVSAYARLVLKDPNGVNDMHKARYIIHVSSDVKKDDGTSCMRQDADGKWVDCGWGVAGISRYKLIPQNGDWMPVSFLDGWITKEELAANPPPFATHP